MASNDLYSNKKNSRVILKCLNNKYYFNYKNKNYILSYGEYIGNIDLMIDDILPLQVENRKYEKLKVNILDEWKKTIDEIETSLVEYNKEYKELMKIVNYYIGLSENAIQLYINKSEVIEPTYGYLEHYTNNYDTSNYLSPLNIRKVNIGNLFGKYIKYKLYNSSFSYKIINEIRLMLESKIDKYMLLATLMFQEEFFDEVKKIITSSEDKKNENVIQRYLSKVSELENILRYVQNEIVDEQIINWLEE